MVAQHVEEPGVRIEDSAHLLEAKAGVGGGKSQAEPPTLTRVSVPPPRQELCQQPSGRPLEHLKSFIGS